MRTAILALALAAATEAAALSCLAPNLARDYDEARANGAEVTLAVGRLAPAGPLPDPPETTGTAGGAATRAEMTFEGRTLGPEGAPLRGPVTVTAFCLGPWCGGFPATDAEVAVMFHEDGAGPTLLMGPCGGPLREGPTPEQIAALERCAAAGRCGAAARAAFAPD